LDDSLRRQRSITTDSPAATRKLVGMAQALQAAGVTTELVSMGRGRSTGVGYHPASKGDIDGVTIHYLPFLRLPVLSQIFSMLALMAVALRLAVSRKDAVHVFYNRLSLYLLAFPALRIAGRRCAIDIEDGQVKDSKGQPAARLSNGPTALFDRLVNNGALLANTALAQATSVRPVMAYYGIAHSADASRRDWQAEPFELLMSGSLYPDTGCDLLADAIVRLAQSEGPPLRVHVTGNGPSLARFEGLVGSAGRVVIEIHRRLQLPDYRALLERCHAGLSLKLIGSPLANSTFPSKTVEFAEHGLLVIATDISDVRAVLGDTAIYLTEDDPNALADLIDAAARDRQRSHALAAAASSRVAQTLAPEAQGLRLAQFLFREAA
jgi:glycosyltransferase involved in cell wall biosynthesis